MLLRGFKIFLLLLLWPIVGYAQNTQAVRLEVPSNIDIESYHVEAIGQHGVLVFYESSEINKDGKRKWYFALFGTSLSQDWLKFLNLPDQIEFIEARQDNRKLHLLFKNTSRARNDQGFYEIVSYDFRSEIFSLISGAIPSKAEVAGFEILGRTACLGLNLKKNITDLLFIDLGNGDINPVHVMPESENMIMHIQTDPHSKQFFIVLKVNNDKRYLKDYILKMSPRGEQSDLIEVYSENNSQLFHSYILRPKKDGSLDVFGTFDIITGRMAGFKDLTEGDNAKGAGLYFLRFEDGKQSQLKYYDFINFDNIHGSLKGRELKAKRKGDAQEESDKEKKFAAYYHMYEPQVLELPDKYVFSVELYTPHYRTETRMDYDFYGRPYPTTYNVFDGYEYYDVVVAAIDKNGQLLWNNDFTIRNIKTFKLQRHSLVFEDENRITIAYVNNGNVISQIIDGPKDIGGDELSIESRFNRDRTVRDEHNRIIPWYGNYMLIYGYQQINNRSLGDDSERTVFYINKIAYQ